MKYLLVVVLVMILAGCRQPESKNSVTIHSQGNNNIVVVDNDTIVGSRSIVTNVGDTIITIGDYDSIRAAIAKWDSLKMGRDTGQYLVDTLPIGKLDLPHKKHKQ